MKILPFIALLILAGCNSPQGEPTEATSGRESPGQTASNPASSQASPGTSARRAGGVAPIGSGAAGGLSPVQNTESVTGAGGGGVNQAAKEQATRAASNSSSVETAPAEESGD